ncbi:MAG: LytR C-terminal domain-containing protein [Patescibacteria group bacterium]|nr:LytR C-terminal domain-containing protein [Patescibacteria group bacterium]
MLTSYVLDDYTANVMENLQSQSQPQSYSQHSSFVSADNTLNKTQVSFPEPKKKESGSFLGLILVIVVLSIILGGGGFLVYSNKEALPFIGFGSTLTPTPTPVSLRFSPTPFLEMTVTPTSVLDSVKADKLDKDSISISVFNGTKVPGEAKSLQEYLLNLGYSNVSIGNASRQDYIVTEVLYSKDVPDAIINEIIAKLQARYQDVRSSRGIPSKGDIEIILGYKKGYSPSPTVKKELNVSPTKGINTTSPTPTKVPTKTPTPISNL